MKKKYIMYNIILYIGTIHIGANSVWDFGVQKIWCRDEDFFHIIFYCVVKSSSFLEVLNNG